MTIGEFEKKLQEEILIPLNIIPPVARSILIMRVVSGFYTKRKGGAFEGSLRFKGFYDTILSFFDELGAGLIQPDDLNAIKGYADGKEDELAGIYQLYRAELGKLGFADTGMARKALVEAVANGEAYGRPTLSRYGSITLRDIYQFTPYRFELFRRIAKTIPVKIVAPTPDDRRKAFGYIVTNMEKYENLGDAEGLLEIEWEEPCEGPLASFSKKLFDLAPPSPEQNTETANCPVTIIKCPGRYREVEEAGLAILKLMAEDGHDYSDYCLVTRDVNAYAPLIEDVFGRYAIPFHFRRGIRLATNPLVISVMSIFKSIESGYERDAVLDIVLSPYFQTFSDIEPSVAKSLALSSKIIDGSTRHWISKLKKGIAKFKEAEREPAERARYAIESLLHRLDDLQSQSRAAPFLDTLAEILHFLKINPEPPDGMPMAERVRFRDYNAHAQLLEILREARLAVESLNAQNAPLGFLALRNLFTEQVESRYVPEPGAANQNRVATLNPHDIVGSRYQVVFALGLTEGEFPAFPQVSSLLNEDERMRFNAIHAEVIKKHDPAIVKGRRVFDRWAEKWQEQSLLFFQTARCAGKRLCLSFSEFELNGEPLLKSQFIEDSLEALYPALSPEDREKHIFHAAARAMDDAYDETPPDEEETTARLIHRLFNPDADHEKLAGILSSFAMDDNRWSKLVTLLGISSIEWERDRYFASSGQSKGVEQITPFNGLLVGCEDIFAQFMERGRERRYTPTDLEKYGQCPFRFFASRALGLEPVEEPAEELDAKSAGNLMHLILENFYSKRIAFGPTPLTGSEDELNNLLESAEEVFRRFEEEDNTGDPAVWRIEIRRTIHLLRHIFRIEAEEQKASGFYPVAVEAPFDIKSRDKRKKLYPPLAFQISKLGERLLCGIIDRIDINRQKNELRVIDYKNSSNKTKYRKLVKREEMGATSFQQPVYMMLAKRFTLGRGHLTGAPKAQGGYRLLKAKALKDSFVMADTADDGVFLNEPGAVNPQESPKTFISILSGVVEKIESGVFPVSPRDCEFCEFPGLCRFTKAFVEEQEEE